MYNGVKAMISAEKKYADEEAARIAKIEAEKKAIEDAATAKALEE